MKIKKTYSFALVTALYLTIFISIISFYFYKTATISNVLLLIIGFFVITFFVIQYRTEHFIYKRIKKIYKEISVLDVDEISKVSVTTDLEKLSKSVEDFVEGKRLEIKNLTERDSFRRDFLGNVAHELKTPLFTVQGYLLTLLEGAMDDKKVRVKYLERANNGVDRLTAIIKDLDMITKLETHHVKMNKEVFSILELIQKVMDLFEMKAKKKNISLKFDTLYEFPIFVNADAKKIEQVLINLMVNSIKYGKINGTTTIGISSYNSDKVLVEVSDNGHGIKKEHLPRLFERFYRVDNSRSREQGGSGLGLAIVKHIIEAHNESIFIKSEYKKGADFSFTLEKTK